MKPNIVIITTHDTGSHFGCYGHETVMSPNIDALAREGVRFSRAFATASMCSPSRAAMMTGRYPQSNGVMGLVHAPWDWKYHQGEKHLSHLLHDAGYATHLFMFQHESEDVAALGFDEHHCPPAAPGPGQLPPPESHPPADQVACSFAAFCDQKEHEDRPFYAQIGFFETHHPFDYNGNVGDDELGVQVPDYYDEQAFHEDFRLMQGLIRSADQAVGVIVDALRRNDLLDHTIVVFTVDHGLPFPRAKTTVYEAGLEVAMIMRWPAGGLPQGACEEGLFSQVDLLPTLFDLIGITKPDSLQGLSYAGRLLNRKDEPVRTEVFGMIHATRHSRSIRTERYKLIREFAPGRLVPLPVGSGQETEQIPPCQLYDLRDDPHESVNLANKPALAEIREELDARLLAHLRRVDDPILQGPVALPFYNEAISDFVGKRATKSN